MYVSKVLILLAAAAFGGFGLLFLISPGALEELASVGLAAPEARAEVRAMYGGLELGLAVFLVWCGAAERRFEAGLMAAGLGFLGLAAARLGGMAVESAWTQTMLAALGVETLAVALCGWGIWRLRRQG